MKCPHCLTEFHQDVKRFSIGNDKDGDWGIESFQCASRDCFKQIFYIFCTKQMSLDSHSRPYPSGQVTQKYLVYPKGSNRLPAPTSVSKDIAEDYNEACLVLPDSPKASAALSRRCLQHILREKAGVKEGNLANEIQQVLDADKVPPYIADSIDAVRNIGNFAAHPGKSSSTGEVVTVEAGEAEWNLDVIELLFDFYYVQPEATRLRKEALNAKLKDAGKPPMK